MFKISPIQDTEVQKKYAEACSIPCREGLFAYAMIDVDSLELMGMSQFEIGDGVGYIADLVPRVGYDDFEAMFILARQTMNFIDLCGAHSCRASDNAASERLLTCVGFKKQNGEYFCNMTGMFDGHCDGHSIDLNK